jgi:hypothetical protein
LANFPTSGGGGSTINYYLNGSVNQGTFGGTTYYEMSKTPIAGAGTNFTRTSAQGAGYIASFITDPGDPAVLNIPGGNFNLEIYFSASSSGGGPSFYGELYKVSASNVFTLIGSGSVSPEGITNGTTLDQYFTSISVPQATLLTTDRLAIRLYVDPDGRNITMHTENGNFCEVITTLSTGLNALNGLTTQVQYFATGTTGTDFSINSVTDTHTFNLPTASSVNRGALSSADWITFNGKADFSFKTIAVAGQSSIVADAADDTLTVASGTGITLTTNASTDTLTITNNAPDQTVVLTAGTGISTSGTYPSFTITNTAPDQTVVLTAGTGITTSGTYPNFTITNNDRGSSQNIFKNFAVSGQSTIVADSNDDTLTVASGTGISLATNAVSDTLTITNTAPDQTVVLTAGTGISTSGTYPSFTITNTAPDQTVVLTAGTGITTSGTYPSFTITNNDRGSSQNIFKNVAVPTQSTITAANNNDTFTLKPGPGVSITTLTANNNITIANTDPGSSQYIFKNIAVSGQSTIVADINDDTLTVASGTGISVTTDAVTDTLTFTNTAPDQTVALTAGTGISVTGTYPNFTITNSSPSSGGTVTSIATTAPITGGTITSTGTIGITQAGASTDGYLSSTDWNTFNNKQPALTNPITGTGTTNYVSKFTGTTTLGNSQIFDNGTNVGIGTATPSEKLDVTGVIRGLMPSDPTTGAVTAEILSFSANPFGLVFRGYASGTHSIQTQRENNNSELFPLSLQPLGGNVGIGATSPNSKLDVRGVIEAGDGTIRTVVSYTGSGGVAGTITNHPYILYANNDERMRITAAGNVGIGTTSPATRLDILGASNADVTLQLRANASNDYNSKIFFSDNVSNRGVILYSNWQNYFSFFTNSAERVRITSTGNVGIGTTSPAHKLSVVGNGSGIAHIGDAGTGGGNYVGASFNGTLSTSNYNILSSPTDPDLNINRPAGNSIRFREANAEQMRILSGGNVGIGTTSPAHKLDVVGNISLDEYLYHRDNLAQYLRFIDTSTTQLQSTKINFSLGSTSSPQGGDFQFASTNGSDFTVSYTRTGQAVWKQKFVNQTMYWENNAGNIVYFANNSGNVGIGTTSPVERLSLSGATGTTLGLSIEPTGWNGAKHRLTVPTSGDASVWSFNYNGSAVDSALYATSSMQINQGNILFSTGATNTAPSERMRINSTGNVGIGTTSPGSLLQLYKANADAEIISERSDAGTGARYVLSAIVGGSTRWRLATIDTNSFATFVNGSERMRIDSSGNVGIGTTSPGARLDVSGIARATSLSTGSGLGLNVAGYAYLSQTISGAMTFLGHNVRASDSVANTAIVQNAGWISSLIKMYYNEGITFHTDSTVYAAGATYPLATTERMRIQVNGNVGIGTTSPWSRFTVSGALSASTSQISIVNTEGGHSIIRAGISGVTNNGMSFVTANVDGSSQNVRMVVGATGNVGIGTTSPSALLTIDSGEPRFRMNRGGTQEIIINHDGTTGVFRTESNTPLAIGTNGSERVRITAAGNVGIGTTSPAASLHVGANGGVIFGSTAGAVGTAQITTTSATSPVSTRFAFGTDGTGWQYRIAKNTAGTIVDLVTVADNGRVGIGTTSPSTLLHVEGRIYAGDIGIATTSPTQKLHVVGNARITGAIFDSLNSSGTAGQVLSSTGTGTEWVTGGGGGGSTIIVKDEGTTVGSSFTTLDFYGSNIQAGASGSTAVITALNNAGTGSVYSNDTTAQYAPTASFANVEINTVTVEAAAPDTAGTTQKLIATVTFGVENVSSFDNWNNFSFRLYNSNASSAIADTEHIWSAWMSKDEGVTRTVFTFHIPLYDGVGASDVVTVQAKQSTAYTPEIYYCAITLIEGTN